MENFENNGGMVRIKSVTIENFKNVGKGSIQLDNNNENKDLKSSILGLYGQNGSGKTALIDGLNVLKLLLSGQSLLKEYADFVKLDEEEAHFVFEFNIRNKVNYIVIYEFCLKRGEPDSEDDEAIKPIVFNEIIKYKRCDGKHKLTTVINTDTNDVFLPNTKYEELIGRDNDVKIDLIVAKKISGEKSRSFVFCKEFMSHLNKEEYEICGLLRSLSFFGKMKLYIIDTTNYGLINMGVLPIMFESHNKNSNYRGMIPFRLNKGAVMPEILAKVFDDVISSMNIVLKNLVPNLTLEAEVIGKTVLQSGERGLIIELFSNKNGKKIPLKYESEGIKKIISILHLLIQAFNRTDVTVAIDELDSGVFEYLLGEMLKIIEERGKGQLIFTSHNLRPLEVLNKSNIAFTTTDCFNRYIRLQNVKSSNNLRDFYYRAILIGGQEKELYDFINNNDIAFAFRKAGFENES